MTRHEDDKLERMAETIKTGKVVPASYDPFQLMDRLDDEIIIQELKGAVIETMVYQYEDKGKSIVGLSKVGVDSAVRELTKQHEVLREMELTIDEGQDSFFAKCLVGRYMVAPDGKEVLLDTAFGTKRQRKEGMTKDGRPYPNPFAYEQAGIKAARNAKVRLIPEDLKQRIIKEATAKGKVQKVGPAPAAKTFTKPEPVAQASPEPATGDEVRQGGSSKAQQGKIYVEAGKAGMDKDELHAFIEDNFAWPPDDDVAPLTPKTHVRNLSSKEAHDLIEHLLAVQEEAEPEEPF